MQKMNLAPTNTPSDDNFRLMRLMFLMQKMNLAPSNTLSTTELCNIDI
jgi:hypothetical protein